MTRAKKQQSSSDKPNSPDRATKEIVTAETRRKIWQMSLAGASCRAIGEQVGLSRTMISNLRREELALVNEENFKSAQEWRDLQLERLDTLMLTYYGAATRTHKVISKDDEVVFLPAKDGLKAAELVLKIMQQRSKLLGLETEKIEHSGGIQIQWTDPVSKDDDVGIGANELP